MNPRKTCLIIDDDVTVRNVLEAKMQKINAYDVLLASDGEEGLALANKHKPDLILLDWMMPGMSGLEVLKQLQSIADLKEIPVFMLTGRGKMVDVERALDAGATGYFTKPIKINELCMRLQLSIDEN